MEIHQDHVWTFGVRDRDPLLAVACWQNGVAHVLDDALSQFEGRTVVFDDKYSHRRPNVRLECCHPVPRTGEVALQRNLAKLTVSSQRAARVEASPRLTFDNRGRPQLPEEARAASYPAMCRGATVKRVAVPGSNPGGLTDLDRKDQRPDG